jgi:predicted ATP-dependent protease
LPGNDWQSRSEIGTDRLRQRYLTEALEKEKVIPKRVTKKGKKMMRSRRSRLADELVFLGRYRTLEKILLYFIKVESLLGCHMYIYIYTH